MNNENKAFWQGVLAGLILAGIVYGFGWFTFASLDAMMRTECHKWNRYEKEFTQYETHPDTIAQCAEVGVTIKTL